MYIYAGNSIYRLHLHDVQLIQPITSEHFLSNLRWRSYS